MKAILTKPEKERLLEQFEKSGKTHAQFAEENGLNLKTLSKWIYEWHHQIKTTNEVKFVEIKTTAISSVNDIRIKVSVNSSLNYSTHSPHILKGVISMF
ncbi:IS66 family insertion sequence element accessory protein TnpA [Streptomyces sp. MH13]|uniref:IS66 family insertion sequence element accessory protein TnpA n=1 Tax=Streptomyces sp. MH13 TaxID=3417651 RepID=UPI003CEB31D9